MHDPFYDLFPRPPEPEWRADELALITIDMQYMGAHPDGWMGRAARSVGREEVLASSARPTSSASSGTSAFATCSLPASSRTAVSSSPQPATVRSRAAGCAIVFAGMSLRARVEQTTVNGTLVYDRGHLVGERAGRFVPGQAAPLEPV